VLALVGCDPTVGSYRPRDLGAGILQRINIAGARARAGVHRARRADLDLEPSQRLEVTELLRRLQHELGTAYLFISHDLTTIASLCHQVAVMFWARSSNWAQHARSSRILGIPILVRSWMPAWLRM